ncbi:putative 2-aminoethylphosphonate ABC transporter ATP-binding protein [Megalodesulfovibrio gigas]|uniref:Putative ABC-type spermidine/putrescine transport system, ATPase component n=1 Tax=Megalodesulfovibrio gigas (strain ATCC 19364 / DSM 1382 / NCIMB 9332 / VKM B-1759) TaxID=1121448 RepID=T2G9U3_MEGG1|nr:putative 2-aminoethylphosphonate ABC transporter ATP-binding protein [Megalodesulfovibrio gigas]AGW12667.1 putative ABC-type spermidine/putrescine transport system, ATPase component [Megalodesulfovibrio gigas DSM 1382 = ATCC 19364]
MADSAYLRAQAVTKRFGSFTALQDVSFAAARGEFISILGPSGCGKTTLLRVVAGLERQDAGEIFVEGRDVSALPVSRRRVGIVFQSYALFPNLSAAENVGYGLKNRKMDRGALARRVQELLDLVGLPGMGRKYPAQLSGGQQQRVALARAMALSPDLLLLDEPLSALDAKVRVMLRGEIRQLQTRLGVTTIMVTHDQEEALTMADRILVMDHGVLVQEGPPHEIYEKPATPFVASFIGAMNFLPMAVRENGSRLRAGAMTLHAEDVARIAEGAAATVAIRPEDVRLLEPAHGQPPADTPNVFDARVNSLEYRGSLYRLHLGLQTGSQAGLSGVSREAHDWASLHADVPAADCRRLGVREADRIRIQLPADRLHVYAGHAASGAA